MGRKYTYVAKIIGVRPGNVEGLTKYRVRRMESTGGGLSEGNAHVYQVRARTKAFVDEYDPRRLMGTWRVGRGGQVTFSEERDGSRLISVNELSLAAHEGRLAINPHGTYAWQVTKNKTLTGAWVKSNDPDYPILLKKGDNGENWLTGPFGKDKQGRQWIRLKGVKASGTWGTGQITGYRLGATPSMPNMPTGSKPASNSSAMRWKAGDAVQVEWGGTWYKATILRASNGQYKIHYDGWSDSHDEVVEPERVRPRR